jgi:hypothetical protein
MFVTKRTFQRALDVARANADTAARALATMTQRNTANVAENVRLFVKVCKAEDRIAELQAQNEELRQDYATLRLAYQCCEEAAKLAVAEMKAQAA